MSPMRVPQQAQIDLGDSLRDLSRAPMSVAGLLDMVPDGLLLVDPDGQLVLVNQRIEELFGYGRRELLGRPVEMLVPRSLRSCHVDHRREYAQHPRVRPMGTQAAQLYGCRRDGSEFPVEISLSPTTVENEQWTVAVVRDGTERLAAERLRQSVVVAEQTRIADEMADGVVRGLFGAGLQLQSLIDSTDGRVREGLYAAVECIDSTIRELRTAIFGRRADSVTASRRN